jgi:hypothetical protein
MRDQSSGNGYFTILYTLGKLFFSFRVITMNFASPMTARIIVLV